MAASIDKHRLLEQQPSPRIVLIGGSNVAFGYDSAEIKRRLAYNPVNMGLHIGLGANFMLTEVEPWLRSGDIVVISFEYALFGDLYNGNAEVLLFALGERHENIRYFSLGNMQVLLNQGYPLMGKTLDASINYFGGIVDPFEDPNNPDNVYKRGAFDQYGDLVLHRDLTAKKFFPPGSFDYNLTYDKIHRTINRLNRFGEICQQKGAKVFYIYPPISQQFFEQTKDSIHEIAKTLDQELKFPILNNPEEMSLPLEDFFDTVYHLNRSGIKKRTTQLIEKLSERIGPLSSN